jgi:Recombination endonuclease VII
MTKKRKNRKYYLKNKKRENKRAKKWAKDYPEKRREINRKSYRKNRRKILRRFHLWYRENAEKIAIDRRKERKANPEKFRSLLRKSRYGLDDVQFRNLLVKQSKRCAICRAILTRPYVDHNHRTYKVRGLLCDKCNAFIGFAKESKRILRNAIKYLEMYK